MEDDKSAKEKADAEFLDQFYSGKISFKYYFTPPFNLQTSTNISR